VPLADEVSLVERYLAIERVRFGDRLGVETHISGEAARCRVPPLLLQPLVENAVKHGVADRLEGGVIRIEATIEDGRLRVRVENPCDDAPSTRRGQGMGLDNVRGRLHALDPHGSQLTATRTDGQFRVVLDLPAVEPGAGLAVATSEPASFVPAARSHGSAAPAGGPNA
jgi:LytS/YehU family sensor histidine kinase